MSICCTRWGNSTVRVVNVGGWCWRWCRCRRQNFLRVDNDNLRFGGTLHLVVRRGQNHRISFFKAHGVLVLMLWMLVYVRMQKQLARHSSERERERERDGEPLSEIGSGFWILACLGRDWLRRSFWFLRGHTRGASLLSISLACIIHTIWCHIMYYLIRFQLWYGTPTNYSFMMMMWWWYLIGVCTDEIFEEAFGWWRRDTSWKEKEESYKDF